MVVSTKLIFLKYTESIYITHTHSTKRMMNEASPIHALKVSGAGLNLLVYSENVWHILRHATLFFYTSNKM